MVELISSLVSVVGFYFAFYSWRQSTYQKRKHLYKLIRKQLECLDPWVNASYGDELTEKQKFDNSSPYKQIYLTAAEPLINLTLLESTNEISGDIIGKIYELYLDLGRIKSLQDIRNILLSSNPSVAESIQKKLDYHLEQIGDNNWLIFLDSLDSNESHYLWLYLGYATTIHCQVIGNPNKGARNHYDVILKWLDNRKDTYDWLHLFIGSVAVILIAIQLAVISFNLN